MYRSAHAVHRLHSRYSTPSCSTLYTYRPITRIAHLFTLPVYRCALSHRSRALSSASATRPPTADSNHHPLCPNESTQSICTETSAYAPVAQPDIVVALPTTSGARVQEPILSTCGDSRDDSVSATALLYDSTCHSPNTTGVNVMHSETSSAALTASRSLSEAHSHRSVSLPFAYTTFRDVMPLDEFHRTYEDVPTGTRLDATTVRVGGRVISMRDMGRILFITIRGAGGMRTLQLVQQVGAAVSREALRELRANVQVGDVVGVCGVPGRTRRGELSLHVRELRVLAPFVCADMTVCPNLKERTRTGDTVTGDAIGGVTSRADNVGGAAHRSRESQSEQPLSREKQQKQPETQDDDTEIKSHKATRSSTAVQPRRTSNAALSNPELRYRYRFVDMMTQPDTIRRFRTRHAVLQALRAFLHQRDFIEVETPMLHTIPSGANAQPFVTHHNATDQPMYLRVAPELYLKQCVVGGMDRVYEIGRVFRNEDADKSHNPEFTSCELYAAFMSYDDLMPLTESLLRHLAQVARGGTVVPVRSCRSQRIVPIDLSRPFARVRVYEAIEEAAGVQLPPPCELDSPRGLAYLSMIMLRHDLPLPPIRTAARMLDKLIDFFITQRHEAPIFVIDHPICMSPLAKAHPDRPGLAERFELFINGVEYCNAYSELNDPQEQWRRFAQQQCDRQRGDAETMPLDGNFLKALQVGLPPTAGWGMGVDRLMALLTESANVREEIIFPLLRLDCDSHDAKRRRRSAAGFRCSREMTLHCLHTLEMEMAQQRAPAEACAVLRQLRRSIAATGQACARAEEEEEEVGGGG